MYETRVEGSSETTLNTAAAAAEAAAAAAAPLKSIEARGVTSLLSRSMMTGGVEMSEATAV